MSVRVEHDAETDFYNLGDDIDGVFITFASIPAASVTGRVTSVQAAADATATATGGARGEVIGNVGDDFNPADFTDNGDGTYTRTGDGVQGRFTPSGFEPVAAA